MRIAVCVVMLLGATILAGCGGGGGSSPSPFAGSWSGTWVDAANAQNGTLDVTIGTDGRLSGSIHNSTLGMDGTASGTVRNSGQINTTYVYPSGTYTASGTIAINGSGHLVGTVQTYLDGVLFGSVDMDLAPD